MIGCSSVGGNGKVEKIFKRQMGVEGSDGWWERLVQAVMDYGEERR